MLERRLMPRGMTMKDTKKANGKTTAETRWPEARSLERAPRSECREGGKQQQHQRQAVHNGRYG